MAMVAEWAVCAFVILDYQTTIIWSLPWLEISNSLQVQPIQQAARAGPEALTTRRDFGRLTRPTLQGEAVDTGTHAHNWQENTVVLLSIFPRRIFSTTSMSDIMEVDDHEPRGTKRTADEAGLPREA